MNTDRFAVIAANYEDLFSQVYTVQKLDYSQFEQSIFTAANTLAGLNNKRVLDVGCGDGATSFRFIEAGCRVQGIDTNPEMVSAYNKRYANQAKAKIGNATNMSGFNPGEIDIIVTGASIHNIPKVERVNFWKEVLRLTPEIVVIGEKIVDLDPVKHQISYNNEIEALTEIYGRQHHLHEQLKTWIAHYEYDERERLELTEVQEALGDAYDLKVTFEMGMVKTIRGLRK